MEYKTFLKKKTINTKVQFYSIPPMDTMSLEQVKTLAIDRLKVLRAVESVSQDFIKGSKEYEENLDLRVKGCSDFGKMLISSSESDSVNKIKSDIKNDIASHFILQIVYCATEELSRWFIIQELDLFKYRFMLEKLRNPDFIPQFMKENNINVKQISENVNLENIFQKNLNSTVIYEVDILLVLDLIPKHKIYFIDSKAYLLESDLLSLISAHFHENLTHSLSFMRLSRPQIQEDGRLLPILSDLHKTYLGKDYSVDPNLKVTADQIPNLSKKSFPPCMQRIQSVLVREHHLKHWARMQYGLFLKGIGLPLDESLKFWRSSFEPVTNVDAFAKRYAYSIRHNYGQEGKRVSYTPYSCQKIITSNPPQVGDCHGCPWQQPRGPELLVQGLKTTSRAKPEQLDAIVTKARQQHFQLSCRDYFRLAHNLPDDYPVTINHPNEYFEESQKALGVTSKSKET